MKRGVPLAELPLAEFQAAHPALDERVFDVLGVERAVARDLPATARPTRSKSPTNSTTGSNALEQDT